MAQTPVVPFRPRSSIVRRRRDTRSASARGYGAAWRRIRAAVLERDPWCPGYPLGVHKRALIPTNSVDHKIPKSRGGTDDLENLRGLCGRCNSRKAVLEEGARPG